MNIKIKKYIRCHRLDPDSVKKKVPDPAGQNSTDLTGSGSLSSPMKKR